MSTVEKNTETPVPLVSSLMPDPAKKVEQPRSLGDGSGYPSDAPIPTREEQSQLDKENEDDEAEQAAN